MHKRFSTLKEWGWECSPEWFGALQICIMIYYLKTGEVSSDVYNFRILKRRRPQFEIEGNGILMQWSEIYNTCNAPFKQ